MARKLFFSELVNNRFRNVVSASTALQDDKANLCCTFAYDALPSEITPPLLFPMKAIKALRRRQQQLPCRAHKRVQIKHIIPDKHMLNDAPILGCIKSQLWQDSKPQLHFYVERAVIYTRHLSCYYTVYIHTRTHARFYQCH